MCRVEAGYLPKTGFVCGGIALSLRTGIRALCLIVGLLAPLVAAGCEDSASKIATEPTPPSLGPPTTAAEPTTPPTSSLTDTLAASISTATRVPAAGPSPTTTAVPSPTATSTPSPTLTPSPSPTATAAPSPTLTPLPSPTATATPSPTATATPTPTPSPSPTATATATPSPTPTPSPSPTATATPTVREVAVARIAAAIDGPPEAFADIAELLVELWLLDTDLGTSAAKLPWVARGIDSHDAGKNRIFERSALANSAPYRIRRHRSGKLGPWPGS